MTSPAPESAGLPHGLPFLYEDAIAAGLTRDQLRTSAWHRLFRGVYASATMPLSTALRARGALLLHPPAAHASHTTAAVLYGIPTPTDPDIHVTVKDALFRRPRPGLRAHVREAGSVCRVLGDIRVSEPAQLFVELASSLSFVDAVVAGDAMVRLGLITLAELRRYCAKLRGKHSRTARRLVRYVREGVDSAMETRLRLLLVLAGLPEPEVNHLIRDEWGAVIRRLDLSYPTLKLIIEFDGRHHIEREQQWEADIERRESLDSDGWRTLVVTSAGIYRHPTATVEKVRRALQSRGVRVGQLRQGYRSHFPGR